MDKQKTIYNWRWWLVLPAALLVYSIISTPRLIIFILEKSISAVRLIDLEEGNRTNKTTQRIVDWVQYK